MGQIRFMATKRKEPAAKGARGGKAPSAARAPRTATPTGITADALTTVTAERDALRKEVSQLRARVQALTAVRTELETRIDTAIGAIQKLLGR
jgi:hypothetical protein